MTAQTATENSVETLLGGVSSRASSNPTRSTSGLLSMPMPADKLAIWLRWKRLLYHLTIVMEIIENSMRREQQKLEMRWRFPFTSSMCEAMTASLSMTAASYPVCRTEATKFPQLPKECEHPRTSLYKHGSGRGRFRECRGL